MFFSFKWKYPLHILLYLGYFSQYFWDECFLLRASVIHLFSFLCYRSQPDTFGFVGRKVSVYLTLLLSCEHGHRQYAVLVVQSLSCVQLFVTPWTAAHQASLSLTISQGLLKLMSIESVTPSNHLILCHPLFLLPSIFPSTGLCSVRCLSEPVPNFSIYSGHFISHFCSCWYYKDLVCSFLLFMEFFDGQKLVIVINWMYQSFPLQFAFLCHF